MNLLPVPFHPRRGFTLIELLIAVTVFAIVLAAVNTVFYGAVRLRNKTVAAMDEALPIEQAVSIIRKDLLNIVPAGGTLFGTLQSNQGTNGIPGQFSPDFYTTTGLFDERVPWAEVQKVCYALVPSRHGGAGQDLLRMVTRNLLSIAAELPASEELLSGVRSATFAFYDGTQWLDTWDTSIQTNMPVAIKMQIQPVSANGGSSAMQPSPLEILVPVVVQMIAQTTAAATATQ